MNHHSNIEWARPATPKEIDSHNYFIQDLRAKSGKSIEYCCQHYTRIIDMHERFKQAVLQEKYSLFKEAALYNLQDIQTNYDIVKSFKLGERQIECSCGGRWKIIKWDRGDFIGCTNYKAGDEWGTHDGSRNSFLLEFDMDGKRKSVLDEFNYDKFCQSYTFSQHYIAEFKTYAGLPDYVKSQSIYEVLTMHGVELLNPNIDDSNFNTAVLSAQNSKRQEALIKGALERVFKGNVKYQYYIKYKYKGVKKEKLAIPDYVCFDIENKIVYVFDAKKNIGCANDKLYRDMALVQHLVKDKAGWKVVAKFIFWDAVNCNEADVIKSDGITIEMLNNGEF